MRRRAFVLVVLIAAGACRKADVYPAAVVQNFMSECTTRADKRICRCALDALQHRFTLEEFTRFEARMRAGEMPPEMVAAADGCR